MRYIRENMHGKTKIKKIFTLFPKTFDHEIYSWLQFERVLCVYVETDEWIDGFPSGLRFGWNEIRFLEKGE